jgi:hypothetical protein
MQFSRRSAVVIAAVLMFGVGAVALVVLASAGGSVQPVSQSTLSPTPRELPTTTPKAGITPPTALAPPEGKEGESRDLPAWVTALLQAVFYAISTLLVLFLIRALYRFLHKVELPSGTEEDTDWERMKIQRLAEAVESGLTAVDSGTATDGVIACWVALEDAAASAGVPREPSETPAEFTVRVLGVGAVSEPELLRLAQLYREARYSTHGSSEEARAEARAALLRLRDDLSAVVAAR